jgi:Uma2 family endonuclease
VKEYWIVPGREQRVEVYASPEAGRYRQHRVFGKADVIECGSVSGVHVALAELFR